MTPDVPEFPSTDSGSRHTVPGMPEVTTLELQEEQNVLAVWLNRPEARNALDTAMLDDLQAVVDALSTSRRVRAVVLRGRGGFFSAGGDLRGWGSVEGMATAQAVDEGDLARRHRRFGTLLEALLALPQAVVAVVEGAAMGGGFGLMTVADVVLARADARLGMPEARLGLTPAQIAPFVVRRIGVAASRRLLVTGRPVDGRQGMQLGLVDHCCEAEADLEAALNTTLRDILRCGPQAVAEGKALLETAALGDVASFLDASARRFVQRMQSDEAQQGIAAFLEHRAPDWADEI